MYWMKAKTSQQYPSAFQKVRSFLMSLTPCSLASSAYWHTSPISICVQPEYCCHTSPDLGFYYSLATAINTSRLKRSLSDGPSALGMMVRCQLLNVIVLPTFPSVKPRPLRGVLQVRYKITFRNPIVQPFAETILTAVTGCYMW